MTDTEMTLVRKRLARDLRILVAVQVIALCAVGLGLWLFSCGLVPDIPEWDETHLLCGVLAICGIVVFGVTAIWGCGKLKDAAFLPKPIRVYAFGGLVLFFSPVLVALTLCSFPLVQKTLASLFIPLSPVFVLYFVVPQFFIARWLAKCVKDSTPETLLIGTCRVDKSGE